MEKVYSPVQICQKFNIVKSTLLRWEKEGHIPAPGRNLRGERQYTQAHYEAIGRHVQSSRHRRRFEQILNGASDDAHHKLKHLGEQFALFKFIHLGDHTGLIELREYTPLQPATLHQLIKTAAEDYHPGQGTFWQIIDLVTTSQPKKLAHPDHQGVS